MTFLDKLSELEYEHVKKLNTLRDLQRHERYFDYEVEEKIIQVLEEIRSSLNEWMKDKWVKISDHSKINSLNELYLVTVQYKRLPPNYNQGRLAKYDCFYHTFVNSSNGRPFSKDVEIIAYMPYSDKFNPYPYMNEGEVF